MSNDSSPAATVTLAHHLRGAEEERRGNDQQERHRERVGGTKRREETDVEGRGLAWHGMRDERMKVCSCVMGRCIMCPI